MTVSSDIREVADKLVVSLPPAFLMLLLINTIFMGALLFFLHSVALERIEAIRHIFEVCAKAIGHE